jgi:hypothetical protein
LRGWRAFVFDFDPRVTITVKPRVLDVNVFKFSGSTVGERVLEGERVAREVLAAFAREHGLELLHAPRVVGWRHWVLENPRLSKVLRPLVERFERSPVVFDKSHVGKAEFLGEGGEQAARRLEGFLTGDFESRLVRTNDFLAGEVNRLQDSVVDLVLVVQGLKERLDRLERVARDDEK